MQDSSAALTPEPTQTIGERMHLRRRAMKMNQEQLAARVGVHPKTISRWETNETAPDAALMPAAADALDVTLDWLLRSR